MNYCKKHALAILMEISRNFTENHFSQNRFLIFSKTLVHVYQNPVFANAILRKWEYFRKIVTEITNAHFAYVYEGFADSGEPKRAKREK